jgi:hypothetical protein
MTKFRPIWPHCLRRQPNRELLLKKGPKNVASSVARAGPLALRHLLQHLDLFFHVVDVRLEILLLLKITTDSGLPDFSWYRIPKLEKFTKWTQNVPIGHKIS